MYAQDIGDRDLEFDLYLIARVYKIGMIPVLSFSNYCYNWNSVAWK